MKRYYFKKIFWVAWLEVKINQLLGMPKWDYSWWKERLKKIRKGEIK